MTGRRRRTARALTAALALASAVALAGCGGASHRENGVIAFVRGPAGGGGQADVYVLHPRGTYRRLTHGGLDRSPAWSPDGRLLAFLRSRGLGLPTLWVTDAHGDARALPGTSAVEFSWWPDSRRLVFTDGDRIAVVDVGGGRPEVLSTERGAGIGGVRVSPDGDAILFVASTGGLSGDLFVMGADGRGRVRVTRLPEGSGKPYEPAWSPDGRRIAFLLPDGVHLMNGDGSGQRLLARVSPEVYPSALAWSPDGRTIAYTALHLERAKAKSGAFLVSADDGTVRRLTRDIDVSPAWSPDGRALALQRFTGFHISQIAIVPVDGGRARLMTSTGHADSSPVWQALSE